MEFSRRCGASAMGFAAGSSRGPPRDAETSSSPRLRPRASKHAGNRKATETRNNESVIPAISQKKQRRHLRARARSHDLTKRSPSRLVDPGALLVPAPRFFLPLGFSFQIVRIITKGEVKKKRDGSGERRSPGLATSLQIHPWFSPGHSSRNSPAEAAGERSPHAAPAEAVVTEGREQQLRARAKERER